MTLYVRKSEQPVVQFDAGSHGICIMTGTGVLDFSGFPENPELVDGWVTDDIDFQLWGGSSKWWPTAKASVSVFPVKFYTKLSLEDLKHYPHHPLRPGEQPPHVPAYIDDLTDLGWSISPFIQLPEMLSPSLGIDGDVLRLDIIANYAVKGRRSVITEIGWTATIGG